MTHPAAVQGRDGASPAPRAARRPFPLVEVTLAGGAHRGDTTAKAVAGTGRRRLGIVGRGDAEGLVPLAERRIVERTFARLGRRRRLAEDFESLAVNALAFLCLRMIRLVPRRLARPSVVW